MKASPARAQPGPARQPISLTVAVTPNHNYLLFRQWSDGLIDVRLVNPLRMNADEWPASDVGGLSFQDRWKIMQYGD